jgi:hypothetical protein
MWKALVIRIGSYTKEEKRNLYALCFLLGLSIALLVESVLYPYYGARTAITLFTTVIVGILILLPMLGGLLVAFIFEAPKNFTEERNPVINLTLFLLFSLMVVSSIIFCLQVGIVVQTGPIGQIISTLLAKFAVEMQWLYFIDAYIVVGIAAFQLREEL